MKNKIVFNSESAFYYIADSTYRSYVDASDSLFCDSFSLSLILTIRGIHHHRLHGPDFMHHLLSKNRNRKFFIIGGTATSHKILEDRYELANVKFDSSNVDPTNLIDIESELRDSKADFIIICLGLYKQEAVMFNLQKTFGDSPVYHDCVITGCGAAIDFLSGAKKRSGAIWQTFGLEWLPRLLREPRMAIRIVRSFIGCLMLLFIKRKHLDKLNKFENSFDG